MAFTFDADPVSATMNSYVSVSYADDYFAARFDLNVVDGGKGWSDFDESTKQALLVSASRDLDNLQYGGLKTSRTQPMQWPRQTIYDNEGNVYHSNALPEKMKYATCELAFWKWTEADRYLSDTDLRQVESVSIGPLDVKALKGADTWPKVVTDLIKSIGAGTLLSDPSGTKAQSMRIYL